jgi:alkylation response protein AidB-like acyl-CoA dehydrogenase
MTVQSATLKHVDSFRRPSVGSEKDLVARAEALIPVLRSRVEETEAGRTLTSETRRDLMESGVHRIFQPKRFGGVEGSLRAGVDILAAIGQGCSATAWVLVQNMTHNWMVAQWPIEAQEGVWGEEPAALLSGILIPGLGKARRVDGGYRLSGRWPFLSGVNVCDWRFSRPSPRDRTARRKTAISCCRAPILRFWTPGDRWACAEPAATTRKSATPSSPNT